MEKSYFLLLLTTLSIVGHVSSLHPLNYYKDEAPVICIPNSQLSYDHNLCMCNSDGTEFICERDMYGQVVSPVYASQIQNLTFECVPNTSFQTHCKDCRCQENGQYASCINTCRSPNQFFPVTNKRKQLTESPNKCIPGSAFLHECNQCICRPDGTAACTNLNCDELNNSESDGIQCVPDTSLVYDCNECYCDSDAKILFCSRIGCDVREFEHKHILNVTMNCAPKKTFEYNCHQCYCDRSGKYAMCSGKACPDVNQLRKIKDTKDKCNPGMIFPDNCNVCVCGQDGKGACTTINCDYKYRFTYDSIWLL